jgi:hypothetical protein
VTARTGTARVLRHLFEHGGAAEVRRAAVTCLGLLADGPSVACVLRATESPETSGAADEALDRFGSDAVQAALETAPELGGRGTETLLRWALERAPPSKHAELVKIAWRAVDESVAAWDVIAAVGTDEDAARLVDRLDARGSLLDPAEHSRPLVMLLARHPHLAHLLGEVAPPSTRLGLLIAEVVAHAGHPVAVEPLREALTAPDPSVRAAAVRALAATGHPSARDALEFGLADEDPEVQAAAAEALATLDAGAEVLEESLKAADARVRRVAAKAIGRREGDVRAALVPSLDDPDPGVVLAVLEALGAKATVDDLLGLTTHGDPDVAAEALLRLRRLDPDRASQAAEHMLDHGTWSVRLEAVRALDTRREASLVALRARHATERDELVREAIERVLAEIDRDPRGGARSP